MAEAAYDVAILGTGIVGTILGAILARHGVRTLLIEQGVHPRFAIGESTVPETTFMFRVLAARYGVPELANLSTHSRVRRHITRSCGVKRNFSFVFHRKGEPQRPTEISQFSTLSPPLGPDVHLFRQDIDAYMLTVAASYGATVRQRTDVTDIVFGPHGVTLRTRDGASIEAQYVVDAGGVKAPVAHALGLRHATPEMQTHSRSIYTHLQGVLPCDAAISGHGLPMPLCQGTLHHLFDGGWMWVIPFDNHPTSTNRLCSVGLNLDPRKHPPTGLPAGEEFRRFVSSYPALKKQFADAVAIRDWVSTDRLQFSSSRAVGDRFCLIPHAFAFVDPLFSSGLTVATNVVNMLAGMLIAARTDGDYSAERFAPIDARVKESFGYFDQLVSRSYHAFSDFELWNSWYKVWLIGGVLGSSGWLEVLAKHKGRGDAASWELADDPLYAKVQATGLPEFASLFTDTAGMMDTYIEGRSSVPATASSILDRIRRSGLWFKPWGGDEGIHTRVVGPFTMLHLMKAVAWMKSSAPDHLRENYFNRFSLPHLLAAAASDLGDEIRSSGGAAAVATRDYVFWDNDDWRRRA